MKNILFKSGIAAALLLLVTVSFNANAANSELKETSAPVSVEISHPVVKSKMYINNGKVEFIVGVPMGSNTTATYELKDNSGKVIKNGTLEPSKVVSFNSDNLGNGAYELTVDGKVIEKFVIN